MADETKKWADNVPGSYFVDDQCIDCDACRTEAPGFFKRNDESGFSFVYRQPETDEDRQLCELARQACPVEAIGAVEGDDLESTRPTAVAHAPV